MFLVLTVLVFGVVIWFLFPVLPARMINLLLIAGLIFLALFSGMWSVPKIEKVKVEATGDLPGTLGEKEQTALSLSQQVDALKEQILSSRNEQAILPVMDEFRKLKKTASNAQSEYEQDRLIPPPRSIPPKY
ncbi:MAG: hypothetical protein KME10_24245 [Plectolyngbya sp. WJT66-NPBG17]|jgi:hypothetical protein|nr:hypothetical protein [Plectolyngbya sp. WJT66-NPBG17]